MRKILFSVFMGGIILVGCSKSSDNSPASIVGTWQVNRVVEVESTNGASTSDTTTNGSVTFNSNGTVISTDTTGSDTSSYSYNSSTKILSAVEDGDTLNFHVTNLTSNNLHYTYDSTTSFSGQTFSVMIDADYKR